MYFEFIFITNPGFVYNIGLTYNASKTVDYSQVNIASNETTTIINNSSFSLIANIEENYVIEEPENCILLDTPIIKTTTPYFNALTNSIGTISNTYDNTNIINLNVIVATGENNFGYGNKYFIGNVFSPEINFEIGYTYKFIQSNSINTGHPLRFSTVINLH